MVGLRKAWFICSVRWLLIIWMLLSPLALSWHLALSPNHSNGCSIACHVEPTSAFAVSGSFAKSGSGDQQRLSESTAAVACPYGHQSRVPPEPTKCGPQDPLNQSPSDDTSDTDHHCPICEVLLLDDVWVMQWDDIPTVIQLAQGKVVSSFCFVPTSVDLPWDVRGPPNLA